MAVRNAPVESGHHDSLLKDRPKSLGDPRERQARLADWIGGLTTKLFLGVGVLSILTALKDANLARGLGSEIGTMWGLYFLLYPAQLFWKHVLKRPGEQGMLGVSAVLFLVALYRLIRA